MEPNNYTNSCWQVDKKISLSFMLVVLLQMFGFAWWAADLSVRVSTVEARQIRYERVFEDITEIKTDVKWIKDAIK